MKLATASIYLLFSTPCMALSSIGIPTRGRQPIQPSFRDAPDAGSSSSGQQRTNGLETAATEAHPWRIVLDIVRSPTAAFGSEGCHMPLRIPAEFVASKKSDSRKEDLAFVQPLSDTVSVTGPDGAVVKPIEGGRWSVDTQSQTLSLELTFPETLTRRDVSIPAGTTLSCQGTIFTQSQLDQLNQEFYRARETAWELGGQLNDMARRQEAPKKWNEEKQVWERRYQAENPLNWMRKRVRYLQAKAQQNAKNEQRPDPNSLSAMGRLPLMDDGEGVYVQKGGVVRAQNGAVLGTWQAEPILNQPASCSN